MAQFRPGYFYSATFVAAAVSAAQDLFEIVAPAGVRLAIHDIKIGQYSDAGDAAAELLSMLLIRDYTVAGSGGSSATPVNISGIGGASAATVLKNNTVLASGGSPLTLVADAMNIAAGWALSDVLGPRDPPDRSGKIILTGGQRLVVRVTAPADALTTNGALVFEEGV